MPSCVDSRNAAVPASPRPRLQEAVPLSPVSAPPPSPSSPQTQRAPATVK